MEKKKYIWDIDCDGYYPYCTNCGEEPYEYLRKHRGILPHICPNCHVVLENTDELNNYSPNKKQAKSTKITPKCFAIDFDGTLVVGDNYPNIGEPNWPVVDKVKKLQKEGHEICLWTCRSGEDLQQAVEYCSSKLGLNFDDILVNTNMLAQHYNVTPNKLAADYYVDDKALSIEEFLNKTDFGAGKAVAQIMLDK